MIKQNILKFRFNKQIDYIVRTLHKYESNYYEIQKRHTDQIDPFRLGGKPIKPRIEVSVFEIYNEADIRS